MYPSPVHRVRRGIKIAIGISAGLLLLTAIGLVIEVALSPHPKENTLPPPVPDLFGSISPSASPTATEPALTGPVQVIQGSQLINGVYLGYPHSTQGAVSAADVADGGVLVSEWPPGTHPSRTRFQARSRILAALTNATVLIEAGDRSGALTVAHQAKELGRPVMAVPSPVISARSAGCHALIRNQDASLVTTGRQIITTAAAGRPWP